MYYKHNKYCEISIRPELTFKKTLKLKLTFGNGQFFVPQIIYSFRRSGIARAIRLNLIHSKQKMANDY
jgi:hypothetical protein